MLQSTKDGLLEEMMKGTIPSTPAERVTILERIKAEGHEEGLAIGHEEGLAVGHEEGRHALLSIARTRCDEAAIRELAGIMDLETLRQRVLALLGEH